IFFFFFIATPPPDTYTLSLHDAFRSEAVAIGISLDTVYSRNMGYLEAATAERVLALLESLGFDLFSGELLHADSVGSLIVLEGRSEEHTSELQSRGHLVCRLLLEKKK